MFPKPEKRVKEKKPLKRKSSSPLKKAKDKANAAFSRYIRTRDALQTTGETLELACITCDKFYPAFGVGCAQAGHFIPGRHSVVLYDERNAHGQCYNCNCNLKGNWVKYEVKMISKYGIEVVEELKELDRHPIYLKEHDYRMIEAEYIEKLNQLYEM